MHGHSAWRPGQGARTSWRAVLVAALVLLGHERSAASDPLRWSLKLESGSEYDTNIHRFETRGGDDDAIVAAPLVRGGARARFDWRINPRRRASLMAFGGAKLFASDTGQDENVGILAADARHEWLLPARSTILTARASYYDTLHYDLAGREPFVVPRHFSMATGGAMLTLVGPRDHRVGLAAGYRRFRYKPSSLFHWHGPHYGLTYRATAWRGDAARDIDPAALDLIVSYDLEQRRYQGQAFTNACAPGEPPRPQCFSLTDQARADLHHAVAAELVHTGNRIYSARYELSITDSNSYGQSLVRQRLELGVTSELIARVFLTARAALQLDIFLDSLLLARDITSEDFTTIDDENRNALSLHLTRDIDARWSMEARYALYTNEFATQELTFRRQIFYLGAVYHYQPRRPGRLP